MLYPLHLKPKHDELLSSWIVRLSLAHGLSPREFSNIIRADYRNYLWSLKDIDLTQNNDLLVLLSERCGVPLSRVRETTLSEFEKNLQTKRITTSKPYHWIMYHDVRRNVPIDPCGMQVCPLCLAEDREPYMRRIWRLPFVVTCPNHESLLIDRCPGCATTIYIHRNAELPDADLNDLTICYRCKFDLLAAPIQPLAEAEVVVFQQQLVTAVRQGYMQMEGAEYIPSPTYFTLLHWMLSMLLHPHPACHDLQRAISRYYNLALHNFVGTDSHSFRSLNVRKRYELVWLLHRLVQDHPERYLGSNKVRNVICHAWFCRWMKESLWYLNVVSTEDARRRQASSYFDIEQSNPITKGTSLRPKRLNLAGNFEADYRAFPKTISKQNYSQPSTILHNYKKTVQQLYTDGISSPVIARLLNVGLLVVLKWLREAGVDVQPIGKKK